MCDRWRNSFEGFYADMGPRPEGKTLDRRDNDGPYSKSNCFWADRKTQARNTRTNRFVTLNGERLILEDAALRVGLLPETVSGRLARGWTEEAALDPKLVAGPRPGRLQKNSAFVEAFGEKLTLASAARKYKITEAALSYRLKKGWPPEKALTQPMRITSLTRKVFSTRP